MGITVQQALNVILNTTRTQTAKGVMNAATSVVRGGGKTAFLWN